MTARIARGVRVVSVIALLLPTLVVGPAAFADAAPIPIDQPIVITESGSYVVTADFTASTGSAIKLVGDITVDIDFAGHTVGAASLPVIRLREYGDIGTPSVTLHDGRVVGSQLGLASATPLDRPGSTVVIERMTFESASVWVEDGRLTVKSSRFVNSAMIADANRRFTIGIFEDNEVWDASIVAMGTQGSVIRRNLIRGGGIEINGSDGMASSNDVVEDNRLVDGGITIGQVGIDGVYNVLVRRNVVSGAILVGDAYEAAIVDNRVSGCGSSGSAISVTGFGSRLGLLERNVLTGACAYGISFDYLTRGNIYRDNVVPRATCALVGDDGIDNVDGGGNKPTRISKKCEAPTE